MPQLDFLIILPQIFWLIIFFIFFHFVLTYFFLPFFLRTILLRHKFIEQNQVLELRLLNEVLKKRQYIFKKLNFTFAQMNSILFERLLNLRFFFLEKPFKQIFLNLNKKIFTSTKNSLYFCNTVNLAYFKFFPTFLNKKKF